MINEISFPYQNKDKFSIINQLKNKGEIYNNTPNIQSVLDLGCGLGTHLFHSYHLLPEAINFIGIDRHPFNDVNYESYREWVKKEDFDPLSESDFTRKLQFKQSDIEEFLQKNHTSFELIYAVNSLHFLDEEKYKRTLQLIKDNLTDNGVFWMKIQDIHLRNHKIGSPYDPFEGYSNTKNILNDIFKSGTILTFTSKKSEGREIIINHSLYCNKWKY